MPSCQNFWELCNLVFSGLWSLLKQNRVWGGDILPGKRMLKHVLWSFVPCVNAFAYYKLIVQVDGTWLYEKYIGTLLIATVNHIFPIAYTHCRRGANFSLGFFLENLRRHVTLQINISLISDRHPSIISVYNNLSNLWVQDTYHFFRLCHIAQNFLRSNSTCRHLKKPLMLRVRIYFISLLNFNFNQIS